MNADETLAKFLHFTQELTESCERHPSIIGLVLVGSTAETFRIDQWSDHDFFIITIPEAQELLRQNLDWLPNSDQILFSFRETEHGLKVVYKSGAVLEFAIFDCEELSTCGVNHNSLAYGNQEVIDALALAVSRPPKADYGDLLTDFRHFLSIIYINVGRFRRGEILAAGQGIRSYASHSLIDVFNRFFGGDERLDKLDPWRRFEFVYPEIGREFGNALIDSPEDVAKNLVALAKKHLSGAWSDYPSSEVTAIKNLLGWTN